MKLSVIAFLLALSISAATIHRADPPPDCFPCNPPASR